MSLEVEFQIQNGAKSIATPIFRRADAKKTRLHIASALIPASSGEQNIRPWPR